jgi:hypothetical protein
MSQQIEPEVFTLLRSGNIYFALTLYVCLLTSNYYSDISTSTETGDNTSSEKKVILSSQKWKKSLSEKNKIILLKQQQKQNSFH